MYIGLVNKLRSGHHEPDILSADPNSTRLLAQFTAALFKLFLDNNDPESTWYNLDFYGMIFGSDESSVCGGGDSDVVDGECVVLNPPSTRPLRSTFGERRRVH